MKNKIEKLLFWIPLSLIMLLILAGIVSYMLEINMSDLMLTDKMLKTFWIIEEIVIHGIFWSWIVFISSIVYFMIKRKHQ